LNLYDAQRKYFVGYDKPRPDGSAQSTKCKNWRYRRKRIYSIEFPADAEKKQKERDDLKWASWRENWKRFDRFGNYCKRLDRRTKRYKAAWNFYSTLVHTYYEYSGVGYPITFSKQGRQYKN